MANQARDSQPNKTRKPKYVIALEEGNGGTLHTFTDTALWAWLNTEIKFPYAATRVTVSIPGTTARAMVTVGSPQNDLAQALVTHRQGIGLREIEHNNYEKKLQKLTDKVGAANVYSGLWY